MPPEQTVPGSHATPQAPQFSGSRATTVHSPAHVCDPAGQDAPSSPLHASTAAERSASSERRRRRAAAGPGEPGAPRETVGAVTNLSVSSTTHLHCE